MLGHDYTTWDCELRLARTLSLAGFDKACSSLGNVHVTRLQLTTREDLRVATGQQPANIETLSSTTERNQILPTTGTWDQVLPQVNLKMRPQPG